MSKGPRLLCLMQTTIFKQERLQCYGIHKGRLSNQLVQIPFWARERDTIRRQRPVVYGHMRGGQIRQLSQSEAGDKQDGNIVQLYVSHLVK